MRYRLLRSIVILAVLFFALWPLSALAASDFPVNVSGLEVFPGIPNGSTVYGNTFAGWVGGSGANSSGWMACPAGSFCGSLGVVINYQGTAGIGHTVSILTGVWSLTLPNGHKFSGAVLKGTVAWPSTLTGTVMGADCGAGVATVSAVLSFISGRFGSFGGCLDDTHLQQVFPPHIWGTISKNT